MKTSIRVGMSLEEMLALPTMINIPTAGRALGIGRTSAYELARTGEFPIPVERVGGQYRVPTCGLLRFLGVDLGERGTAA